MLSSRRPKEFRIVDISSGHHHAQGSACPVDQDAFLAPSLCPGRWDCVQWLPPKTRFSHGAIGGLPFPVHAVQLPAFFDQDGSDTLQHSPLYPTLEGPVDGAVIPQLPGQVVPLAGTAHTEDDPFQHLPLVHPFAPLRLGWVQLQNHRLNSLPQIIWYFPYRWQSLPLSHHPPPHKFPLS